MEGLIGTDTEILDEAKIDRLQILGVRSFGNINPENIQFQAPLTLIVGYNGSGKTTIIECLKYATTGQLPPNSKGGAFIHDPKLCGEKEVLAQVRLRFESTSGTPMVVTRNLQLTVKKTSRTQKTLEGTLMMNKDGERTVISARVAELDTIVPQYLGVSEAILDSVIFCHQEDSLWPMSEPSVLKKKFDEIFEALKYTKAIDNIKQLRKKQDEQYKQLRIHEANHKENKDKGERVQRKSLDLEQQIEVLRAQEQALNLDMEAALAASKEKHLQAQKALGIVEALKTKRQRAQNLQENVDNLKENLEELKESDEWLETTLAQYEQRMAEYQEQEEEYQVRYLEVNQILSDCRRQYADLQAEKGQREQAKKSYEEQIEARSRLVQESARTHGLRGYDGDLDAAQIAQFVDRVQKLSRDKDREMERIKQSTDNELSRSQAVLTDFETRRSNRLQDRVNAKKAITENEKKSSTRQREIDAIKVDEGARAGLEASYKNAQDRLQKMTEEYASATWEARIQNENKELRELETEAERLRVELVLSTKMAKDRAQLEFLMKETQDRKEGLDLVTAKNDVVFQTLISPHWDVDNLERDFHDMIDTKSRAVAEAKKVQESASRELNEVEFKLKSIKELMTRRKLDLEECQNTVLKSIDVDGKPLESVDDYLPELELLEATRNQCKEDLEMFNQFDKYWNQCLDTIQKKDKCRLCDRKFTDPTDRTSAVNKIRQKLADANVKELQEELRGSEQQLAKAMAARAQYDIFQNFSHTDIPALQKDLQNEEVRRAEVLRTVEERDKSVIQLEASKRVVEALTNDVHTIARYQSEIGKYEADIARISSQQKLSGSSLSLEEIEKQHAACSARTTILRAKIAKITADKDLARTAVGNLEGEINALAGKLSTAQYQLEKKQALVTQLDEILDHDKQLWAIIQQADADLEALVPELAKAKARHDDALQRGRAKETEVQSHKNLLAQTVNQFKLVDDTINRYVSSNGPADLAACKRSIESMGKRVERVEVELQQITTKANELKKKIDDSEHTKRSIIDNLRYRRSLQDLQAVTREIAELDERGATDDYQMLSREAVNCDKEYQKSLAERGPVIGSMKAKDEELARYLVEWDTDYKDAAQKYREARYKAETTKAAIEDLAKYVKALDAAIMKYHSLKMEEINRIAGELWQDTYQGTDVDTIMIRSENENAASKRSYNYRVVMVKEEAEMDMRGRCSAGQKVLASIIIRLALSECFGVNCGIIALDEPTTNLDQDNIKALADSLHKLIQVRKQQRNFQLLVITHDEEFLKAMRASDFADSYWRVGRDEKQKSVIEKQSLADFM